MNYAKKYFKQKGTVYLWWYPEKETNFIFEKQMEYASTELHYSGKRVLDVGTGRGRFANLAASNNGNVHSLDISQEMLELSKKESERRKLGIKFILGDCEDLPYKNKCFDIIICMELFMHLPNSEFALNELARVLKPNGILLINISNKLSFVHLINLFALLYLRFKKKQNYWTHTLRKFKKLLNNADLQITKITGWGLVPPSPRIHFFHNIHIPLLPHFFCHWFFKNIEERLSLKDGFLLYFMKSILVISTHKK